MTQCGHVTIYLIKPHGARDGLVILSESIVGAQVAEVTDGAFAVDAYAGVEVGAVCRRVA